MRYHQSDKNKNDHRITALNKIKDKFDYGNLSFPLSLDDIKEFENINKICVYVYEVVEEVINTYNILFSPLQSHQQ